MKNNSHKKNVNDLSLRTSNKPMRSSRDNKLSHLERKRTWYNHHIIPLRLTFLVGRHQAQSQDLIRRKAQIRRLHENRERGLPYSYYHY